MNACPLVGIQVCCSNKMMAKIYNGRAETAGECESEQTKREKKKWKIGKRSWIVRGEKKKKTRKTVIGSHKAET